MLKLISAFGLVAMVGIAWLMSQQKRLFPWRTVLWGIALQFLIALFVLRTNAGLAFFNGCQRAVDRFIGFADEGNRLVFGPLAKPDVLAKALGAENTFLLVITVTGTIILVAAVSTLLYHYGILQVIVRGIAWVMRRFMGTSGSETLAMAANIFMGQTEAPLVIPLFAAHDPQRTQLPDDRWLREHRGWGAGGVFGDAENSGRPSHHAISHERPRGAAHFQGAPSRNPAERNLRRRDGQNRTRNDQRHRCDLRGRRRRNEIGDQCGGDAHCVHRDHRCGKLVVGSCRFTAWLAH